MTSEFINLTKEQKIIPIIGKGTYDEINSKINYCINKKYKIIEITMRSQFSLEAAIDLKKNHADIKIGIGSIISIEQLIEVSKYNFTFYVSPGINSKMLEFAINKNINFIPGVSSSSDIIKGIEFNYSLLKFFPSEQIGGVKMLKSLIDIFPNTEFIPTGGINKANYKSYLELSNVIAVGSTNF